MKISKLFILVFCLLLSASLFAETEMRVYGYVFDTDREPIEFVTVQVVGSSVGTITRSDGYYELTFPLADTASILYSFLGYESFSYKINTKHPRVQKMVILKESAIVLGEAEIKTFRDQTSSVDVLDLSKLKSIPNVSGGGIESLISTYAGVSAGNELSSQYSVRGGSYDENSVYVNNIEVYRPLLIRSGQQEGLSFINPELVAAVSFSAGGFDPKYGDKMASVLDIQYKKPKGFEASVSASLLGASAYVGHLSNNKKFSQIHGIRYKSSNYMLGALEVDGAFNQQFIDYQTYMTYNLTKKWELSVLGNFSQNSYSFVPDSLVTTFGTLENPKTFRVHFNGNEKDLFQTLFGAATLKYSTTNNLTLSLLASAFNTSETVNYDIEGQYWLGEASSGDASLGIGAYHDFARNTLNATVVSLAHRGEYQKKKNKLEWGASLQQELINDRIDEFQIRDSAGYSLPFNVNALSLYYNLHAKSNLNTYRTQAFIQDAFKIAKFSFVGGLRANYWSFNDELLLSPRLAIAYMPSWKKDFIFRFSTGVYYQSPFYKEIKDTIVDNQRNVLIQLNKDIQAQRSLHFVLGSDYRFKWVNRPFKFTTEVYYKPSDRVITYKVDNVKIIYAGNNDAKAYTAGLDLKLFGEFVPGTDSWINLSLMNAKENAVGDEYGYVSRPNEQRLVFSTFFQDYFPGFPKYRVHLKFIWADGLPYWAPNAVHTTENTLRARSYRRVDIGFSRALAKGDFNWLDKTGVFSVAKTIQLGLEIFNLLDIQNVESYYWVSDIENKQHPVPNTLTGRRFNFRLSVDF